jgi:hypothetical protein
LIDKWVQKLNKVLDGFGGYPLQFQLLDSLKGDEWDIPSLQSFSNSETHPPYIQGRKTGAYGFPVYLANRFMGLVTTNNLDVTSNQRLQQLSDLVTLVLETALSSREQIDFLDQVEQRLLCAEPSPNVISFRNVREELRRETAAAIKAPLNAPVVDVLHRPLLLYVTAKLPLERVAVEIHNRTQRWAFISVDDLPDDIFQTPEGLRDLGAMTLFVRDIARLTENQQNTLAEYISIPMSPDVPLLIVGTTVSPVELERSGRVRGDLLRKFAIAHLQWDEKEPLSELPKKLARTLTQLASRPPQNLGPEFFRKPSLDSGTTVYH